MKKESNYSPFFVDFLPVGTAVVSTGVGTGLAITLS